VAASIREFITGWLDEIGIATEVQTINDSQLIRRIGLGEVDLSVWGWDPYVDPSPQLSYLTCSQVVKSADDPTNYLNDANWCNEEYDALYEQQNTELDPERRVELVHEALELFYREAPYVVLYYSPTLQAYRTDRFEGWVRQPGETGPVIFSNTSPSYAQLVPAGSGEETAAGEDGASGDDDSNLPLVLAIAAGGIVLIGGGALLVARRRGSADERE
jgi:peptide/nickel transport system substrate-binding protein